MLVIIEWCMAGLVVGIALLFIIFLFVAGYQESVTKPKKAALEARSKGYKVGKVTYYRDGHCTYKIFNQVGYSYGTQYLWGKIDEDRELGRWYLHNTEK